MSREHRRSVEDFEAVLRAISLQEETVILVGGHAVNVWALSYRDRIGDVLIQLLPFTSGDMDVYATRNALLGLHDALGGKLLLSGPREITDGTLIVGVEPDTRELDVLRSVNGLPRLGAQDAIRLVVCGHAVPVLIPAFALAGQAGERAPARSAGAARRKTRSYHGLGVARVLARSGHHVLSGKRKICPAASAPDSGDFHVG